MPDESLTIVFRGGAAHAIGLVAARTGRSAEEVINRAVCSDVCCWLFDSDTANEPKIAEMFGLQRKEAT